MSYKICAKDLEEFKKLEGIISVLDEGFLRDFDTVDFIISGFNDVRLISNNAYYKEDIALPNDFVIKGIAYKPFSYHEKNKENEVTENIQYNLEIRCSLNGQSFTFIFNKLLKNSLKITV